MGSFKKTRSNIAWNLILLSVNSKLNYVKLTTWISSRLKQMFSTSLTTFLNHCLKNFHFLIFENFQLLNQIAFPDY